MADEDRGLLLREFIQTLLPKGTAWTAAPDSWFSKFIDGFGDSLQDVYDYLKGLAFVRDPDRTNVLLDLEREYGIIPGSQLDEETRRAILNGKVYAAPDWGVDALEFRLASAGFKDLDTDEPVRVYRNEDRDNPNYYLGGDHAITCGYQTAVCGHQDAFCGLRGIGGKLLVSQSSEYSEQFYTVPMTDGNWHMVFFVGGEKTDTDIGFVEIEDGDMEAAGTSAWTAGGGATLSKDTIFKVSGAQSLKIQGDNDYARQDVSLNENSGTIQRSYYMRDTGGNVLRWNSLIEAETVTQSPNNGVSFNNPTFDPGTNSTDTTEAAVSFDSDQGGYEFLPSGGVDAYAQWVKVNDAGSDPYFRVRPTASGYANLPQDIEVNGVTLNPVVRYEAKDADLTSWDAVAGEDLPITTVDVTDPTIDELAPGLTDKRVDFSPSTESYLGTDSTIGRIEGKDVVMEIIFKTPEVFADADYVCKDAGGADFFTFFQSSAGQARFHLASPTGGVYYCSTPTLDTNTWYHVIGFADRDESQMIVYTNGAPGTAVDISGLSSSTDVAVNGVWEIGKNTNRGRDFFGSVAYFSLWTDDSGTMNTASQQGVARRRAAMAMGVNPTVFQDLSNPDNVQDLDMEEVGTGSWSQSNATLSKESGSPGGSGSSVLRLTTTSTSTAKALQTNILAIGNTVRVTGWARADGVSNIYPAFAAGRSSATSDYVWNGNASNTWQFFDVTFTWVGGDFTLAGRSPDASGDWVEFDDITITMAGDTNITLDRNYVSYVEKWNEAKTEMYLIPVGEDWIPTDEYKTPSGDFALGCWLGDTMGNRVLYSNDFTNAVWSTQDLTVSAAEGITFGGTSYSKLTANAGVDLAHSISQNVDIKATGRFLASCYVNAGTLRGIMLENSSDTTQYAVFDLVNGVISEEGTGLSQTEGAFIEDKGDGWYRCAIFCDGTASTQTVSVFLTDGPSSSDIIFTSDGSSDYVYIANAQVSSSSNVAVKKYVETTSSVVEAAITYLSYHGLENCAGRGGVDKLVIRAQTTTFARGATTTGLGVYNLNKDGDGTNGVCGFFVGSLGDMKSRFRARQAGSNISVIIGSDTLGPMGEPTVIEHYYDTAGSKQYIDRDNDVNSTTSVPFTEDLTYIELGESDSISGELDGYLNSFEVGKHGLDSPRGITAIYESDEDLISMIGYDELSPGSGTYELRGYTDSTGVPSYNYGTYNEGEWHHVGLDQKSGTSRLYVDGVEVESHAETQDTSLARKLSMGWTPHDGYDDTDATKDYTVATGDVTIADIVLWEQNSAPAAEWYQDRYSRGVPSIDVGLVHEFSVYPEQYTGDFGLERYYYDFISGNKGTASSGNGSAPDIPAKYTEAGVGINNTTDTSLEGYETSIDFGASAFLAATSHTYMAWVRTDSTDGQIIWENDFQTLNDYQSMTINPNGGVPEVAYYCVVGGSVLAVTNDITVGRLYHIAVTRDYNGSTTTIKLYINGQLVQSASATGAPDVTRTNLTFLSDNTGSAFFFQGRTNQNRFYSTALDATQVQANHDAGLTIIETGPYATQTITPTTKEFNFSGWAIQTLGVPLVLYKQVDTSDWEVIYLNEGENFLVWENFTRTLDRMYEFRLYVKDFNSISTQFSAQFDDIDGGSEPGESTVQKIKIPLSQKRAFEELILRRKPLHSWAVLVVEYVSD